MPSKVDIQNAIWGWVTDTESENIITDTQVETAYRRLLSKCQPGTCKRNCQANPHCFEGLFKKEKDSNGSNKLFSEMELELKEKGMFVGLSNLGATCYVNCFLQLWYHNADLRQAIYMYEFPLDELPSDENCDLESYADKNDQVGQLQSLFGLLQYSERRNIDPKSFISSLNLDANEQQDAQEFSKLFLSLIESRLCDQPNPDVRDIITTLFQGRLEYNTQCSACSNISVQSSLFYELDLNISSQKNLYGCLQDYIREEKLAGDEKYCCSVCKKKQDALRFIKLKNLPPYLNLQLLRFVYNRQTGKKTKLKGSIEFPEVLDMSPYVEKSKPEYYDLNAILIHRGMSAYEGHYMAVIKDRDSNSWYRFNDESIEHLKSLGSRLDSDDVLDQTVKAAPVKNLPKGTISSKNAYMLVYRKREFELKTKVENPLIPVRLERVINADNIKCKEWLQDIKDMKEQNELASKRDEDELLKIWENLPANPDDDWEFLSTAWITKWLSRKSPVDPIDNSFELCLHDKMPPSSVKNYKFVKTETVNILYNKYGGGPRMGKNFLCKDCVIYEYLIRKAEINLNADAKIINSKINNKSEQNAFWVGKRSLQNWRKLALQILVPQQCELEVEEYFNNDLLCSHGNLTINKACRKLVTKEAWEIFRRHFPQAIEFSDNALECLQCQGLAQDASETKSVNREIANQQKTQLSDLYYGRNRPQTNLPNAKYYAVNVEFINSWKKYLRQTARSTPVTDIANSSLLCEHGLLKLPIVDFENFIHPQPELRAVLLWEEEWQTLKKFVTVDHELIVTTEQNSEVDSCSDKKVTFKHQPGMCAECFAAKCASLIELRQDQMLKYSNGKIYIHVLSNYKNEDLDTAELSEEETKVSESSNELVHRPIKRGRPCKETGDQLKGAKSNKRKKVQEEVVLEKGDREAAVRRSSRRQRSRDEILLRMSSNQTLENLKVEIMNYLGVSPVRMHLTVSGTENELTDLKATLEQLRVPAGSTIDLKLDEEADDFLDDKASAYEEGFKGTQLLGH